MGALSSVERRLHEPKLLQCSKCEYLVSSWYFIHQIKWTAAVLVPSNGHSACKSPGARAAYKVLDGSPSVDDVFAHLDYCKHDRMLRECRECSSYMCSHGKRIDKCGECQSQWQRVKRPR